MNSKWSPWVLSVTVAVGICLVGPSGVSASSARTSTLPASVLRTVSNAELSRFYVYLRSFKGVPVVSERRAVQGVHTLMSGMRVLEAVPALVKRGVFGRTKWTPEWVVSLQPAPGLKAPGPDLGHPILSRKSNRKPFMLVFVNPRTGRYDGEVFQKWVGHFWEEPCSIDLRMHEQVDIRRSNKWVPTPVIRAKDSQGEPSIGARDQVRFALTASPSVCFDRHSRAELYFRRSYVARNGTVQYRNWVGHGRWTSGRHHGTSWRFIWRTKVMMQPKSKLLLASWNIDTASGTIGPSLLIHVRR